MILKCYRSTEYTWFCFFSLQLYPIMILIFISKALGCENTSIIYHFGFSVGCCIEYVCVRCLWRGNSWNKISTCTKSLKIEFHFVIIHKASIFPPPYEFAGRISKIRYFRPLFQIRTFLPNHMKWSNINNNMNNKTENEELNFMIGLKVYIHESD